VPGAVAGDGWPVKAELPMLPTVQLVAPVAGLRAAPGDRSVTLTWTRPTGGAWFVVRRSAAAGGAAPATVTDGVDVPAGSATTATATGLVNGGTYAFSVFAMSARGWPSSVTADACLSTRSRAGRPAGV